MAADPDSDYLERAREIWGQYQFYILIGLAMVLSTIAGFTYQHGSSTDEQKDANMRLYRLLGEVDAQRMQGALDAYAELENAVDFPELRNLGAFALVSLHLADDNVGDAETALRMIIDTTEDDGFRSLAVLRLAEILINSGDFSSALEALDENIPARGRLQILFEERIGDAHYAGGDFNQALEAYSRASELAFENARFYAPVLNIKRGAILSSPDRWEDSEEIGDLEITDDAAADDTDEADDTDAPATAPAAPADSTNDSDDVY